MSSAMELHELRRAEARRTFNWDLLAPEDLLIAARYIGGDLRQPDLTIAYADSDLVYLYRWHVIERTPQGNVYFHIQVADDPERPEHDHPWDNQTVMLAGAYRETILTGNGHRLVMSRVRGDVVHRRATDAHRLELMPGHRYAMTQFSTGPVQRDWGYIIEGEWVSHNECNTITRDGIATFAYPERYKHLKGKS